MHTWYIQIHTDTYNTYRYVHDTGWYIHFTKGFRCMHIDFWTFYRVHICKNVYIVCISCTSMYLEGVHIRLYLTVSASICMYLYVWLYLFKHPGKSLGKSMGKSPDPAGICLHVYVCVCMWQLCVCMCMYVFVSYVSLPYPGSICKYCMYWPITPLNRSHRPQMTCCWGPTQGDPGQVPDHFTPP